LARTRDDIAADGSRVEASHKGWNSIQRSFPSGIEVFSALAHDFVLRRNIRVASSRDVMSAFLESTHGSHHIGLTHRIAQLWNQAVEKEKRPNTNLQKLPEMLQIDSQESFGLGTSKHVETFGGITAGGKENLFEWKGLSESYEQALEHEMEEYLQNLDIHPSHRLIPLSDITSAISTRQSVEDTPIRHNSDQKTTADSVESTSSSSGASKRKANTIEDMDESQQTSKKPCPVASSPVRSLDALRASVNDSKKLSDPCSKATQ